MGTGTRHKPKYLEYDPQQVQTVQDKFAFFASERMQQRGQEDITYKIINETIREYNRSKNRRKKPKKKPNEADEFSGLDPSLISLILNLNPVKLRQPKTRKEHLREIILALVMKQAIVSLDEANEFLQLIYPEEQLRKESELDKEIITLLEKQQQNTTVNITAPALTPTNSHQSSTQTSEQETNTEPEPNTLPTGTEEPQIKALQFIEQGFSFFYENKYEEALEAIKQAIRLESRLASVSFIRGMMLFILNRYQEALGTLKLIIELDLTDRFHFISDFAEALEKASKYPGLLFLHRYKPQDDQLDPSPHIAWSSDGYYLAVLGQKSIHIFDVQSGETLVTYECNRWRDSNIFGGDKPIGRVLTPATLTALRERGDLYIRDTVSGIVLFHTVTDNYTYGYGKFLPDESRAELWRGKLVESLTRLTEIDKWQQHNGLAGLSFNTIEDFELFLYYNMAICSPDMQYIAIPRDQGIEIYKVLVN